MFTVGFTAPAKAQPEQYLLTERKDMNKNTIMKKGTFILLVLLFAVSANAQITIIDTVIVETEKYKVAKQGIERIERVLTQIFDREKVATDTMLHLNESVQFVTNMKKVLAIYGRAFYAYDTIQVKQANNDYLIGNDTTGIIKQYQTLNARVEELKTDPQIKYVEAVEEFKKIQERKKYLKSIYDKIKAQNP